MGRGVPGLSHAKKLAKMSSFPAADVPKGYCAVYVWRDRKEAVSDPGILNQPVFQSLLSQAKEEFRFDHPIGGLKISCREDIVINLVS